MAQLQRVFIVTPAAPQLLSLRPVVKVAAVGDRPETSVDPGFDILLPNNSLLCLRLPYVS